MTALSSVLSAPSEGVMSWGVQFLAIWLLGLVLGWLLPKPKWVDRGLRAKALLLSTPPGLWTRRIAVAAHLSLIVREVWRNLFAPGTFRRVLRNAWRTVTTGARFEWPQPLPDAGAAPLDAGPAHAAPVDSHASWHITSKDLAQFKWIIDDEGGPEGCSKWEPMMEKQWPGCTYTAWRRTLPGGKSEYKSVTVSEDATAEEFMEFYLDDETRMKWDSMITETQLLETNASDVGGASRCQVVRWLRTFPFSFISQREYIIARRFFREADGSLCAVTRGLVDHPAAPRVAGQVRMESFYSCWRSRNVPCPHGSGRPAVETTLLHFEDFRINERLARFAVRHGMAGFVKGMIPAVQRFVAERRQRCDPHVEDLSSFGRRQLATAGAAGPAAGLPRTASLASTAFALSAYGPSSEPSAMAAGVAAGGAASCSRSASVESVGDDSLSERSAGSCSGRSADGGADGSLARSSSMRRLGAMMLASGVAIALARTASTGNLPSAAAGSGSSGPHAHARRHGGQRRHGSSGHGHSHGHHSSGHSHGHQHRRSATADEQPPRPRRRQHPAPAAV